MLKLITPVQYEPALEELNAVRPLHLQERPRISLDIPIANKLPKASVKSTAGTLARCTPSGALLNKNVHEFTSYEMFTDTCNSPMCNTTITFSQTVYKIMVNVRTLRLVQGIMWTDNSFTLSLVNLKSLGKHYIDFVGKLFRIKAGVQPTGAAVCDVYGFY